MPSSAASAEPRTTTTVGAGHRWEQHESPLARVLRTRQMLICVIILVLAGIGITTLHTVRHQEMSPVDELQHIDYLFKAPQIVHSGEKVGQDAMREQACRRLPAWPQTEACSTTTVYDPDDFQESGSNTAAIYTPLYYTVTKVVAWPIEAVTGIGLVSAARLVGGLWLAGGLVMTLLAARRLGANPFTATGLLLATAAVPTVLYPAATITPDAAALLCGASLLWSVLWWQESPSRRWWLPAVLSGLVVAVKALNILVVVLLALYVLVRAVVIEVRRRRAEPDAVALAGTRATTTTAAGTAAAEPTPAQSAVVIAAMSAVALALAIGYIVYTGATAVASSDGVAMTERSRTDSFPVVSTVEHLGVFLRVFFDAGSVNVLGPIGSLNQQTLGLIVFGATFAALLVARKISLDLRLMALSLMVIGVIGAPLIIAFTYFSQGIFVPIPGRYALTLIPVGVAVAAATLRDRPARATAITYGAGAWLATAAFLVLL